MAQVHYDLTFGVKFDVSAVHGSRRRTFEVDPLSVITAAVTRALELVFTGLPVRSAAEMRANRRDHENTLTVSYYPDSVLALELGVDAVTEVRGVADLEPCTWLVENTWKEKAKEHQEIYAKRTKYRRHDEPAAARDGLAQIGFLSPVEDGTDHARQEGFLRKPWIAGR